MAILTRLESMFGNHQIERIDYILPQFAYIEEEFNITHKKFLLLTSFTPMLLTFHKQQKRNL